MEALCELRKPFRAELGRQRCRKDIMHRPRAHRCKVGQIYPQKFSCNRLRRIFGQVVNSGDYRIHRNDETPPRPAINERGVVAKSEPPGPG